jgi:hypothetical protein
MKPAECGHQTEKKNAEFLSPEFYRHDLLTWPSAQKAKEKVVGMDDQL